MGLVSWAKWAREARGGGVVLATTGDDWMTELPELCPQVQLMGVETCSISGEVVMRLSGADDLLLLVPEPAKAGSRTPGNLLPW